MAGNPHRRWWQASRALDWAVADLQAALAGQAAADLAEQGHWERAPGTERYLVATGGVAAVLADSGTWGYGGAGGREPAPGCVLWRRPYRPMADSLPAFTAPRGGIRYVLPTAVADVTVTKDAHGIRFAGVLRPAAAGRAAAAGQRIWRPLRAVPRDAKRAALVLAGCTTGNYVWQALTDGQWATAAQRSWFQWWAGAAIVGAQRLRALGSHNLDEDDQW